MPDTTTLGSISVIIIILAVLGLIFLRRLVVRFFYNVLDNPAGRIVLGTFMCVGGLIFGFSSSHQNHWSIGGAIAGGGLLLLLITLGIPYLSKRWEKAAAEAPHGGQSWPTTVPLPPPPPGIPYMPTSQPGGFLFKQGIPTPQGGFLSTPGIPTPRPGGPLPPPAMPTTQPLQPAGLLRTSGVATPQPAGPPPPSVATPQPGGSLPPGMGTRQPGGFLTMPGIPTPQPGGVSLAPPPMPAPMPGNMATQSTPGGSMPPDAVKRGRKLSRRTTLAGMAIGAAAVAGGAVWEVLSRQPHASLTSTSGRTSPDNSGQALATAKAQLEAEAAGQTWNSAQSPASTLDLRGVIWTKSQFIAVGYAGVVLASDDGISWAYRVSVNDLLAANSQIESFAGVAWSGSQYVAVGAQGLIITATDLTDINTWRDRSANKTLNPSDFEGIAWSGSLFVAVGEFQGIYTTPPSPTILTSPDGQTWTLITSISGDAQGLLSITWTGSQFVAVGFHGTILTSPDGHTWTVQTSGSTQNLFGVAKGNTQTVVVGDNGTILTSPDGRTWTAQTSGTTQGLLAVAWSGFRFVVVGDAGTILTSTDGSAWTAEGSSVTQNLSAVAWSGSRFVTVGGSGDGMSGVILKSP